MPELPDIEGFRVRFEKHALHRPVAGFHAHARRLLKRSNPQGVGRRLHGRAFVETRRHGKFLLARLENDGWLALHFGMTGDLAFYKNGEPPPDKEAVRIDFRDGGHLAYLSLRLLGRLQWVESEDSLIRSESLGPDALSEDLSADGFMKRFSERKGMLKTALMDQSRVAGIGNIFSDEILFQSGRAPKTALADLETPCLREIYRVMRRVLRTAVKANVKRGRLPPAYLGSHREPGGKCPRCGTPLRTMKAAGRTCYYCPSCQSK